MGISVVLLRQKWQKRHFFISSMNCISPSATRIFMVRKWWTCLQMIVIFLYTNWLVWMMLCLMAVSHIEECRCCMWRWNIIDDCFDVAKTVSLACVIKYDVDKNGSICILNFFHQLSTNRWWTVLWWKIF